MLLDKSINWTAVVYYIRTYTDPIKCY